MCISNTSSFATRPDTQDAGQEQLLHVRHRTPFHAAGSTEAWSCSSDSCIERRKWLEEKSKVDLTNSGVFWPKGSEFITDNLRGNIERPIGLTKIPFAAAGPLEFRGDHAQGSFYGPMATTEPNIVGRTCKGAMAINMAGGVVASATVQRMTRSPMFFCASNEEAVALGDWLRNSIERIQREVVSKFSRRAQLKEIVTAFTTDVS